MNCCIVCGNSSVEQSKHCGTEVDEISKLSTARFVVRIFLELGDLLQDSLSNDKLCSWWTTCDLCGELFQESLEIYRELVKLTERFQRNRKVFVDKCRNVCIQDCVGVCEATKIFQAAIKTQSWFGNVSSVPILNLKPPDCFQTHDFVKEEVSSDDEVRSERELPSEADEATSSHLETNEQSIKEEEEETKSNDHQDDVTFEENVLVESESQRRGCRVDGEEGDEESLSEKDFSGDEEDDEYHPEGERSTSEEETESDESDESFSNSWRKRNVPSESGEDLPNLDASTQHNRKRARPNTTKYASASDDSQEEGDRPSKRLKAEVKNSRKQEVFMGIPGINFLPEIEQIVANPVTNKLHCPKCDFRCINKPVLQSHFTHTHLSVQPQDGRSPLSIFRKHPETQRYLCPECDHSCTSRTRLNFHYHRVHLNKPLPECTFSCTDPECGKSFSQQDNFLAHMGKHKGTTPRFRCSHCPQVFHSYKELFRHVQTEHEGGREKKHFICEQCGKGFPCSDNLNSHRSMAHTKKTKKSPVENGEAPKPKKN